MSDDREMQVMDGLMDVVRTATKVTYNKRNEQLRQQVKALESRQVPWGGSYVSRAVVRLDEVLAMLVDQP